MNDNNLNQKVEQNSPIDILLNRNQINYEEMYKYYLDKDYDFESKSSEELSRLQGIYNECKSDYEFYAKTIIEYAKKVSDAMIQEYDSELSGTNKALIKGMPNNIALISPDQTITKENGEKSACYADKETGKVYFCLELLKGNTPVEKVLSMEQTLIHETTHLITNSKDNDNPITIKDNNNKDINIQGMAGKFFDEGLVEKASMDIAMKHDLIMYPSTTYHKNVLFVESVMKKGGISKNSTIFNKSYDSIIEEYCGVDTLNTYKDYETQKAKYDYEQSQKSNNTNQTEEHNPEAIKDDFKFEMPTAINEKVNIFKVLMRVAREDANFQSNYYEIYHDANTFLENIGNAESLSNEDIQNIEKLITFLINHLDKELVASALEKLSNASNIDIDNFDWTNEEEKQAYENKASENQEHLLDNPLEQSQSKEETLNNPLQKNNNRVLILKPIDKKDSNGFISIISLLGLLIMAIGIVTYITYNIISR